MSKNVKKRIPDRWEDYSRSGSIIEGTKIICFKVPLTSQPPHLKRWNVKEVLKENPDLGAVVDLTNTDRYYNPREFVKAGVQHVKIAMEGRIIPPKAQVDKFIQTIDDLLNKNIELIGVHCTHGLNRSGYMVCRYMRDKLNIPAKDAIAKFEAARGHPMERANYVSDLLGKASIPPPDIGGYNHFHQQRPQQSSSSFNRTPKQPSKSSKTPAANWRDRKPEPKQQFKNKYKLSSRNFRTQANWRERKPESEHQFSHEFDY